MSKDQATLPDIAPGLNSPLLRPLPPPPPPRPPYEMPQVCVGMNVLWHQDGNASSTAMAATVCNVGQEAVDLFVMQPNGSYRGKTGVRYVDDPKLMQDTLREMGAWSFTEETKAIRHALGS